MTERKAKKQAAVERIYARADDARMTIGELCKAAGVNPVTCSRGRADGSISIKTLDALEKALDKIEAERAAA